jgi:multidrug efflux pump subunit AcrA (membrane-fusion protein)
VKRLLWLGIVFVFGVAGFLVYGKLFPQSEIKVLETARVEKGKIRGVLVETGIVKPQVGAQVKVGTRATGTIVKMNVQVGDRVRKDQLIALIDDREIRKGIEQAKAALESAQKTLRQAELTYPQRIQEAKASNEYAQKNAARLKDLAARDYIAKDDADKALSQADMTGATLKRFEEEYRTQRQIALANVEDRAAQLRQQEVRLTYTEIYAPMDGVVSEVTAQEGETMVAGLQVANLVTVLDPSRLEMWIYVDETDIGKAQLGQAVEYYVDTFPTRTLYGRIDQLYPQPVVKDNIVYYLAIVRVSSEDASVLKPEMTTHVRVIFAEKQDVLIAPNAAVKFERGTQIVYRVTGPNQVQKVDVAIGIRGEEFTEILSGTSEHDELATKLVLPVALKSEGAK